MQFLNPYWFFGFLALSIPILIHFVQNHQGKILKVGSISFLETRPRNQFRQWAFSDLLLLLLRCLLLSLLVAILVQPFFYSSIKKKGDWVLVPSQNSREVYFRFKKPIDSLLRQGGEVHLMDSGFKSFPMQDTQSLAGKSAALSSKTENYFIYPLSLESHIPKGSKAYFFTDNLKRHFQGDLPKTSYPLFWNLYSPEGDSLSWVEKAWEGSDQKIHIRQGLSEEKGTFFISRTINTQGLVFPFQLKISPKGNTLGFASIGNDAHRNKRSILFPSIDSLPYKLVEKDTLKMALFIDPGTPDVHYIESALRADFMYLPTQTQIDVYIQPKEIKGLYSWIFWLKKEPSPLSLISSTKNFFTYAYGESKSQNSWIIPGNPYKNPFGNSPIALYRRIESKDLKGNRENSVSLAPGLNTLWEDGYGHPLLTDESSSLHHIYTFYSRMDPDWNDLVWSDTFPVWLMDLISPPASALTNFAPERRGLQQGISFSRLSGNFAFPKTNLDHEKFFLPFLFTAFLLILIGERFLSQKTDGKIG